MNEVFWYVKFIGVGYINKLKMRDYVYCYVLYCLDVEILNILRKEYKEWGENVGVWC